MASSFGCAVLCRRPARHLWCTHGLSGAGAVARLVDHACEPELEQKMRACIEQQPGVLRLDVLRTREFGNKIYVDVEIAADAQ